MVARLAVICQSLQREAKQMGPIVDQVSLPEARMSSGNTTSIVVVAYLSLSLFMSVLNQVASSLLSMVVGLVEDELESEAATPQNRQSTVG